MPFRPTCKFENLVEPVFFDVKDLVVGPQMMLVLLHGKCAKRDLDAKMGNINLATVVPVHPWNVAPELLFMLGNHRAEPAPGRQGLVAQRREVPDRVEQRP